MTTDNLVKHGFLSTLDVCLMHGTNGTFLPGGGGGETGRFFSGLAPRPRTRSLKLVDDGRTDDDDGRTPEHGYTISSPVSLRLR